MKAAPPQSARSLSPASALAFGRDAAAGVLLCLAVTVAAVGLTSLEQYLTGSAWLETLEELVSSAGIEPDLSTLVGEVSLLLEPVAKELVVVRPIGFEPLTWVRSLAAEDPVPSDKHLTSAAVSIPGVLLTQIAAVRALARQGMDLNATPPVAVAGHSQGVLAVEALKAGQVSLADMAAELGYSDQAHFTHDFRTVTGMTPGAYLRDQPGRTAPRN